MKFGIRTYMVHPKLWLPLAIEAESLGFESVWLPEHLVLPVAGVGSPILGEDHPPISPSIPVYDAFIYLAAIASRTDRIRLATHVYNIGLRHPFVTARAISTLDVLSGGRVEFGIGASWNRQEWEVTGLDFDTRGPRVDEALTICQALWSKEVIEHHGAFFNFAPVMFEPKPVQRPWPPVHMGGDAEPAIRRAALLCDGWVPANHTIADLPEPLERIKRMRQDAGRPDEFDVTLNASVNHTSVVDRYAQAGVTRMLVQPWTSSRTALDGIREFAEKYM